MDDLERLVDLLDHAASARYGDPFSEAVRLITTLANAAVELPLRGIEPAGAGDLPLPWPSPGEV